MLPHPAEAGGRRFERGDGWWGAPGNIITTDRASRITFGKSELNSWSLITEWMHQPRHRPSGGRDESLVPRGPSKEEIRKVRQYFLHPFAEMLSFKL